MRGDIERASKTKDFLPEWDLDLSAACQLIGVDWKSLQKQTNGAIETEPKGTIKKQPGKRGKKIRK